jgi:hypothetical protein
VTELTVKRWRRYGKDRLYVNLPDGRRVGWYDLQTESATLELKELREAFGQALKAHGATFETTPPEGTPTTTAATVPAVEQAPTMDAENAAAAPAATHEPFAVTIDWRDVGAHEAGKAARLQAIEKRQQAPVKTFVARVLGVHTDERAWRVGAAGERRVGARLDKLPVPWRVLHAIPVGHRGADIDHLAIGPAGVFTVNTKHHPQANVWVGGDTFLVNGHRQPYVRNARHEARRAARLLSAATGLRVEVSGIIAVVGAHKGITIKAQPEGVQVVAPSGFARSLPRLPAVLDQHRIETIYGAARRSDTWG